MTIAQWFRHRSVQPLHIAGDHGEGPVIILIHGIASSSVTFRFLEPLLVDRYRVITIDLLGFGESDAPATIDSLRLKAPFILVGHSLGSLISARYAAIFPARVARVVLISPPVYLAPAELGNARTRSQVGAYLKAYEFIRANKEFTIANAARVGRLLGIATVFEITERNWTAFILSLKNCIEAQTSISDIASVKVSIDVVYGALDQFITPGTMRIIEQMRHVTMHRIEAADHVVRKRLARAVAEVIA
ncbi:alpha/beta fold hydrolase [Glaciihabitans sp. dw_435]|uniref:alpha/beta fold hydrolase n=1 Tax=Glaciihabitans sp. dw_435 TaxID=2720081 RepID=UPI001BD3D2A1|nr:alpha/beta hydrolase [Glaciihabitans sp. dw_435]